jgi:hypothetical protein
MDRYKAELVRLEELTIPTPLEIFRREHIARAVLRMKSNSAEHVAAFLLAGYIVMETIK